MALTTAASWLIGRGTFGDSDPVHPNCLGVASESVTWTSTHREWISTHPCTHGPAPLFSKTSPLIPSHQADPTDLSPDPTDLEPVQLHPFRLPARLIC